MTHCSATPLAIYKSVAVRDESPHRSTASARMLYSGAMPIPPATSSSGRESSALEATNVPPVRTCTVMPAAAVLWIHAAGGYVLRFTCDVTPRNCQESVGCVEPAGPQRLNS